MTNIYNRKMNIFYDFIRFLLSIRLVQVQIYKQASTRQTQEWPFQKWAQKDIRSTSNPGPGLDSSNISETELRHR